MEAFRHVALTGTYVLLAIMGGYLAASSLRGRTKWIWIVAFVLVAGISGWANFVELEGSSASQKLLTESITGGENYLYFEAKIDNPTDLNSAVPLWTNATGQLYEVRVWISPGIAQRQPDNPAYWNGAGWGSRIVEKGRNLAGIAIRPGDYWIEITAKNGTVNERLRLVEHDGRLVQVIDVTSSEGGRKLYSSARPEGFVE